MSQKRPRTPPPSSPLSPPSPSPEPFQKAARTSPTSPQDHATPTHPLLCTLPPTCNPPNRPTPLANTIELEAHYATYHAHVCEEHGCGCIFPEAHLLELHQTECHDPIAAVRKERGEKIFACHLATCPRFFKSPKTRRLHLIQAHGYPKEYFFAVTNKGVGGLLKKWGEGASMVRSTWKARGGQGDDTGMDTESESDGCDDGEEAEEDHDSNKNGRAPIRTQNETVASSIKNESHTLTLDKDTTPTAHTTPTSAAKPILPASNTVQNTWLGGAPLVEDSSPSSSEPPTPERLQTAKAGPRQPQTQNQTHNARGKGRNNGDGRRNGEGRNNGRAGDKENGRGPEKDKAGAKTAEPTAAADESLAHALGALSLVPSSVRFGRGASRGGFMRGGGNGHAYGHGNGQGQERTASRGQQVEKDADMDAMDVDGEGAKHEAQPPAVPARGKVRRGRGGGGYGRAVSAGSTGPSPNAPVPVPPTAATSVSVAPSTGTAPASAPANTSQGQPAVRPPGTGRPPMPPRGFGRGALGRFPGRARIMFGAGRMR